MTTETESRDALGFRWPSGAGGEARMRCPLPARRGPGHPAPTREAGSVRPKLPGAGMGEGSPGSQQPVPALRAALLLPLPQPGTWAGAWCPRVYNRTNWDQFARVTGQVPTGDTERVGRIFG